MKTYRKCHRGGGRIEEKNETWKEADLWLWKNIEKLGLQMETLFKKTKDSSDFTNEYQEGAYFTMPKIHNTS